MARRPNAAPSAGRIFAAGQQADIPALVGSNADEGTALLKHFTRFMGEGIAGLTSVLVNRRRIHRQPERRCRVFVGATLPEVKAEIEDPVSSRDGCPGDAVLVGPVH